MKVAVSLKSQQHLSSVSVLFLSECTQAVMCWTAVWGCTLRKEINLSAKSNNEGLGRSCKVNGDLFKQQVHGFWFWLTMQYCRTLTQDKTIRPRDWTHNTARWTFPSLTAVKSISRRFSLISTTHHPASPHLCCLLLLFKGSHVHSHSLLLGDEGGQVQRETVCVIQQPCSVTWTHTRREVVDLYAGAVRLVSFSQTVNMLLIQTMRSFA